jgi:hypothetical protein
MQMKMYLVRLLFIMVWKQDMLYRHYFSALLQNTPIGRWKNWLKLKKLVYTYDKLLGKHKYRKEKRANKECGSEVNAEKTN